MTTDRSWEVAPQMPRDDEIRLAMGELTADQMRTAKAAIRRATNRALSAAKAEIVAAKFASLEEAAGLFDGFSYGVYAHPAVVIRAYAKTLAEGK